MTLPSALNLLVLLNIEEPACAVLLVAILMAVPTPFQSTLLPWLMVGVVIVTVVSSWLLVLIHVSPSSVE